MQTIPGDSIPYAEGENPLSEHGEEGVVKFFYYNTTVRI